MFMDVAKAERRAARVKAESGAHSLRLTARRLTYSLYETTFISFCYSMQPIGSAAFSHTFAEQ